MDRPRREHIASGDGSPSVSTERGVWTVTVSTFVLRFATGLTGALLIFLLADFEEYGGPEVGPAAIGVFTALFFAAELALSPPFGLFSDRVGHHRVMQIGPVFGFIAVVLTGAGLFTSDCATQMVPWYRRRVSAAGVTKVLVVAYLANFVGAIGLTTVGWLGGILTEDELWTPFLVGLAEGKVSHAFTETFAKGILANMLVCVAAWQAYSSRSTTGKVLGIWFPVMAFVALGTEHSVANMFFIPAAMFSGADITVAQFLTANLLPATLGNWVGGALIIGLPYAWLYSTGRVGQVADAPPGQ